ncbi:MAG: cytochrome c biogenesis protein [Candidatus Hydrogenedentota bacterium]
MNRMIFSPQSMAITLALLIAAPFAGAQETGGADTAPQPPQWDTEVLDTFARLPVQEGGRVKPLDTLAQFTLLSLNGKRAVETPGGEERDHLQWMLDCLFFPEIARTYPNFVVNSYEAIEAIGVAQHEKKRDRYSYAELAAGRDKLMELGSQYDQIDRNARTSAEQQIADLAHNVLRFEGLIHFLDFARVELAVPADTALAAAAEGDSVPTSKAVALMAAVAHELSTHREDLSQEQLSREQEAIQGVYRELLSLLQRADSIAMVPHPDPTEKEWVSPGMVPSLVDRAETQTNLMPILRDFEEMAANAPAFLAAGGGGDAQAVAFVSALEDLEARLVSMARARGEYSKVPIEVFYYNWQFLYYALVLYVLSFLVVAFSWLFPASRILQWIGPIAVCVPTALLIVSITLRSVIRARPPVTTLYETLLFVTAVVVVVALAVEYINRRRIALSMGAFLGMVGLFLSFSYEAKEGVDTMPSLIAVLDTNFWLATHVTTVTMGYGAGLFAGALAHLYIFGRLLGIKRANPEAYRGLTRMVYGVVCFGVLFAMVGTVLGGIWANDSWGRFWGWDPKENGALLIVLWGLIILHARLGLYIRDLGVHMSAIVLAMVVAFSWWGVNLLGVGLHSYGFTHGIWRTLMVYWGAECVVLLLGGLVWLLDKRPPPDKQQTPSLQTGA